GSGISRRRRVESGIAQADPDPRLRQRSGGPSLESNKGHGLPVSKEARRPERYIM
ncbi:uncharacterized protein METZ01_LOCUS158761, partial [marine metagenome]